MLTMISSPQAQAHHLLNRDGTAALCRKNITPYTWTTARTTTSRTTTMRATYEVHGEALRRSTHTHRVTCLACQRKLTKITAEAFDAATAEDPSHTGRTATPAAFAVNTRVRRICDGAMGTVAEICSNGVVRVMMDATRTHPADDVAGIPAAFEVVPMGPEAFDHLPADHPAPVVSAPAYRIRDTYGHRTFLVLGTGPTTNAPHLTSVWVQREGEQGARVRTTRTFAFGTAP